MSAEGEQLLRIGDLIDKVTDEDIIIALGASSIPAIEAATELGDWLASMHPRMRVPDMDRLEQYLTEAAGRR